MITFLLIIHGLIALLLIAVVLLQKSEGGSLGFGGGGNSMFSARGSANFLTRTTAILAIAFMVVSMLLAVIYSRGQNDSILDNLGPSQEQLAPKGNSDIDLNDLKPFGEDGDNALTAPKAE